MIIIFMWDDHMYVLAKELLFFAFMHKMPQVYFILFYFTISIK